LDLDDLLLLVEVVESVNKVEVAIVAVEAVDNRVKADLALGRIRKRSRSVDRLCSCVGLVRYIAYLGFELVE